MGDAMEQASELFLFKCPEAYVYQVPPSTTSGHRAETWQVDHWLQEVSVGVIRLGNDDVYIRLSNSHTGELFAECPVTMPLQTCIEAVVDSSRYFVLRIVDKDSGRHAFVGLGFRQRDAASDFNAALYDHVQYLERRQAAQAMHEAHEAQKRSIDSSSSGEEAGASPAAASPPAGYSLRPGESIHLDLRVSTGRRPQGRLTKTFSLMLDTLNGASVAGFAPAPPRRETPMGISPSHSNSTDATDWGDFESA